MALLIVQQTYLRRNMMIMLKSLLLLLLLITSNRITQFGKSLYRWFRRSLLKNRRCRRDNYSTTSCWYTQGNCDNSCGSCSCFQNIGPRFQRRRWRSFGTLRIVLESYVVVRVLGLRNLALAGSLEGNVTL